MPKFGVVVKVADPETGGNLRSAMGEVYLDPQATGGKFDSPHKPLHDVLTGVEEAQRGVLGLMIQVPCFTVGELLAMDGGGRDQMGRKPSKWDIEVFYTDDIDEAIQKARKVVG